MSILSYARLFVASDSTPYASRTSLNFSAAVCGLCVLFCAARASV